MKLNQGKCHLRIFAHKFETIRAKIEKTQTGEGREQKWKLTQKIVLVV